LKLLFDANLSPRLPQRLADLFPGSQHVVSAGLGHSTADAIIWQHAADQGFVIVTADSDFLALARRHGAPPHVVHLVECDYKTAHVEALLRRNALRILGLENSNRAALTIKKR
jgi:predicted nuclease of predicted toxin-antitoxin system